MRERDEAEASLGRSRARLDKRFLQELEASVEILVGYDERDENSDDVSVEAAREEDEPALAGGGSRGARQRAGRRLRPTVIHELDRQHRAEPPDLADGVDASRNRLEARPDQLTDLVGASAEVLARDFVQNGQRRRAGERVPAEGAAE